MRSRIRLLGVQAEVRGVLKEHLSALAREIRGDAHFVDAVVHAGFVEGAIAERAGQRADRAPDRTAVETATLERPARRVVAADAELPAAIVQRLIGAVVPDRQTIAVVDVPIGFQQHRPDRIAGWNHRLHASGAPVVGDGQRRGRAVVEILDTDEEERLVLDDWSAQVSADAILIVGRGRREELRLTVRVMAGVRRAVQ